MNNTDRIPEDVLTNGFKDGDDWDAATLNKIVAVLIAGINANYASLNNTEFVPNPSLQIFLEQTYNPDKAEITQQLDGKITSYFTDNDPNTWDATERAKHDGDMWYLPTHKMLKRYKADTNEWVTIEDSTAVAAYEVASNAQDTADGKRRIFLTQPVPPYDVGDLWTQGATGDILRCKTQKLTGSYNAADWEIASKYTDDTVAHAAQSSADTALNKLTDISSDSKLTPDEKQAVQKEWDIIVSEKPLLTAQAELYLVSHVEYDDVYDILDAYLTPLLSDLTTTNTIDGNEFRSNFQNYYDEKTKLINTTRNEPSIIEDGLIVSTISHNNLVNDHSFELTVSNGFGEIMNPKLYVTADNEFLWQIDSGMPKLNEAFFLSDNILAKFDTKCAEVSDNDKLKQKFRLKKNTTYTFSGYYKTSLYPNTNPKIFIQYSQSDTPIPIEELTEEVTLDTASSEVWKRVKYTFTTPSEDVTYTFTYIVLASTNSNFIIWDGIQLIEAPTPCIYNAESQFFKYANEKILLMNDSRVTPRDGWIPALPRDGKFRLTDVGSLPICTISLPHSQTNGFIYELGNYKIKFSTSEAPWNFYNGIVKEINTDDFFVLMTVQVEKWVTLTVGEIDMLYYSNVETPSYFPVQELNPILDAVYPIGRGFIDFTNTDYSNYLGFTWEKELVGMTPVGLDTTQTEFNTIGKTGGSKTHTHQYGIRYSEYYSFISGANGTNHFQLLGQNNEWVNYTASGTSSNINVNNVITSSTKSVSSSGYNSYVRTDLPNSSNLQPYKVVNFWKRIA